MTAILLNNAKALCQATIVLSNDQAQLKAVGYYIADVTDERSDKTPAAHVLVKQNDGKLTQQLQDLQSAAIRHFLTQNVVKDTTQRAVSIGIKNLHVTETLSPDGNIDGHVQLTLSFGLLKNYGTEHLVDYSGILHYIKPPVYAGSPEQHIRAALKRALLYFNNWMKVNESGNRKLARSVRFMFNNFNEQPEGDTIYYSPARRLTWNDFQSKLRPLDNSFSAEVLPEIGYQEHDEMVKGVINVYISLKPNVQKSSSWKDEINMNSYSLNHEQKHFDIAQVVMLQFAQKIKDAHLTPDNYEAFISMQYFDSERDMAAMQKAYDRETSHGMNKSAQADWNDKIDALLKTRTPVL